MATRGRSRTRSRSRDRDESRDRPANARMADKRVYISNIPYDSRWQDIKDLFRKEVGEVAFVELFNDENDRPRGCGVIEFADPATAKKAIDKMHRFEMSGRKIVVKEDYDIGRDKQGRIMTGNAGGGGGRGGRNDGNWSRGGGDNWIDGRDEMINVGPGGPKPNFGNTYGLSQNFLENLGIDGPLIPKIFISNLDFRVDDRKLKEVFRLAGRIMYGEVNKDKDGKSRGHGIIEYEHPVEAVQAISMFNNQQLYERVMHVKLDRLSDPLADLAKNKLPEGLRSIGRGLKPDGSPLTNVASNMATQSSNMPNGNQMGNGNGMSNPALTLSAMSNLATQLVAQQAALANIGQISNPTPQFNTGATVIPGNAIPLGVANVPGGLASGVANIVNSQAPGIQGNASQQPQQPQFQNSGAGNQGGNPVIGGGGSGGNYREMDYGGYAQNQYSQQNQQQNFGNTSYSNDKPKYNNGVGGGQVVANRPNRSNTVIVNNLPPSCTWQTLKSKFRECGEVVFAEKRDNNTGVVRFANDRDAEAAINMFDQSRVDGRLVEVRFL